MRVAIYYAPSADHPLTRAAASWLGRDAFAGEPPRSASSDGPEAGPDSIVAAPRRYGFHATMKPPFRLATGVSLSDAHAALKDFCSRQNSVELPALLIVALDGFIALVPETPSRMVQELAATVVEAFDALRAPITDAELATRRAGSLSPPQEANLQRWGYPYVLEEFRFHMTLSGPLAEERRGAVIGMLQDRLRDALREPLAIDSLALFVEPEPGADFHVHSWVGFGSTPRGP